MKKILQITIIIACFAFATFIVAYWAPFEVEAYQRWAYYGVSAFIYAAMFINIIAMYQEMPDTHFVEMLGEPAKGTSTSVKSISKELIVDTDVASMYPEPKVIGKIDLNVPADVAGHDYEEGLYFVYHVIGEKRYRNVGHVQAHSLEDAFSKAQNDDEETTIVRWSINDVRSTMVGDVIETPSHKHYTVLGTGFKFLF